MSQGLPYDGWYNGNVELMMLNGTFADFRHMFVKQVELGKMKQVELDKFDKQWEAIPLEEKIKLREMVVDDTTPKEVTLHTHDGPVKVYKAKPSEGNNVKRTREREKVKKQRKTAPGALTNENNPLISSK